MRATAWFHAARSAFDYHYTRRSHVLMETADRRQGFALFGGFRARHRFAALYLPAEERTRTRLVAHQPATADDCRRLVARLGLVVFCGDAAPSGLAAELLTIPFSVDLEVPTPSVFDGPGAPWGRSTKANIAKVKREQFAFDIVDSREWVKDFRRRMLLPSMRTRHGVRASVDSGRALTRFAHDAGSELLRVLQNGNWVAACFNQSMPDGYLMRKIGWLDGNETLHRSGVVSAAYLFSFQRAAALGLGRIVLGGVEPCLEDGLFRYKSYWGARLSEDSRDFGTFALLLEPSHPACLRFLRSHSFIMYGADRRFIVFSGHAPEVADVSPAVRSGIARWYVWREQPVAVPEVTSEEVPRSLRPWVRLAASAAAR